MHKAAPVRTGTHAGNAKLLGAAALVAAGAATMVAWAAPADAAGPDPTAPKPSVLSCADLAPLAEQAGRPGDRVIEAEGRVSASGAEAIPPYLVLCAGAPRIACIMETPLAGADAGHRVHVMGRWSGGDRRMLVIDPCGATLTP